jgi:hypothetical protein
MSDSQTVDIGSIFDAILAKVGSIVAMFPYGSQVYGTTHINSDWDVFVIVNGDIVIDGTVVSANEYNVYGDVVSVGGMDHDICVVTLDEFRNLVNKCDVKAIEMIALYNRSDSSNDPIHDFTVRVSDGIKFCVKPIVSTIIDDFNNMCKVNCDTIRRKIRPSFSGKYAHSEVKARQKIKDNEILIGVKSMYHSIRITIFGILFIKSIMDGEDGTFDFKSANHIWNDIYDTYLNDPDSIDVKFMKNFYKNHAKTARRLYCNDNMHLVSTFKHYAPK